MVKGSFSQMPRETLISRVKVQCATLSDERLQRLIGELADGPAAPAVARAKHESLPAGEDRSQQ